MASTPAAAVTASSNAFFGCWDRFVALGDQWYKQQKEWKTRKIRMGTFREEIESWKKAASDRGLSSHEILTKKLDAATDILTIEEDRLEKMDANRIRTAGRHVIRTPRIESCRYWTPTMVPQWSCLRVEQAQGRPIWPPARQHTTIGIKTLDLYVLSSKR